jgi:hypothetical protein
MARRFVRFEFNVDHLAEIHFMAVFLLSMETRGKPHNSDGDFNVTPIDRRERPP